MNAKQGMWLRARQLVLMGVLLAVVSCLTGWAQNPILPGDHPDPSIIRVGQTYWTASTSGDWAPQFPLYRSNDLHHWTAAGAIFTEQPAWATGSFWAPELVSDGGRVLVYYVARKRDGPLCVAAATAAQPQGPYTDHGPIVCQSDGSIDPAFARDEHGVPYLIWKEDGNSVGKPTPLWAQPLTADLLHLTGDKTQLLVNDAASWEGGVMEAPYVLRHNGEFFLFYAGNACCGVECKYAEGVARAPHLLGPWTRDPANPIIRPNGAWRCPGHGSAVKTPAGDDYFLYHAYPVEGSIYLGRESVLDRIVWSGDGWPTINGGHGPSSTGAAVTPAVFHDDFRGGVLGPEWRWHAQHRPTLSVGAGKLTLTVSEGQQAMLARSLVVPDYTAEVTESGAGGSLVVVGAEGNTIGLGRSADGASLELWQRTGGAVTVLWKQAAAPAMPDVLQVTSADGGKRLSFAYKAAGADGYTQAGGSVDVSKLPQWDTGLRVGLLVRGQGQSASFGDFALLPGPAQPR